MFLWGSGGAMVMGLATALRLAVPCVFVLGRAISITDPQAHQR